MNPSLLPGILKSLPSAIDVLVACTAQTGYLRSLNRLGHLFHRLKVTIGSYWKPGFYDIHVQLLQLLGNPKLFVDIHAGPGRLLTVT